MPNWRKVIVSGSDAVLNSVTASAGFFGTASYAEQALSSSYALTASYLDNYIPPFPFTGSAIISGSLEVSGSTRIKGSGATSATTALRVENTNASASLVVRDDGSVGIGTTSPTNTLHVAGTTRLSGSYNTATSGSILTIEGSGSAQPIFKVQGSVGELFAITDSLSGSLFSVNDITGLPILEVFSDNTINLGNYQAPALFTTAEVITDNSGSFTVYSIPTSSYDGAFYEYTLKSGSNARAGNIMAIWSGTQVNYTETTTTDFGDTSGVSLGVFISGSNMVLTGSFNATDWHLKTIIKSI